MNKKPSPKLLRWAEEEKGQSLSVGILNLHDVVAAADEQESRNTREDEIHSRAFEDLSELDTLPASPTGPKH